MGPPAVSRRGILGASMPYSEILGCRLHYRRGMGGEVNMNSGPGRDNVEGPAEKKV